MEYKKITMKEALDLIFEKFDVLEFTERKDRKSFWSQDDDGVVSFFFDKRQYEREDVLQGLSEIFSTVISDECQIEVDSMTMLWTRVILKPLAGPINH